MCSFTDSSKKEKSASGGKKSTLCFSKSAIKEASIRKLIYEIFARTKRKKATVRELNEMGYRTRNDSLFTHTTIARLLRDTTAKGVRLSNYTSGKRDKTGSRIKPKSEWKYSSCSPIVSEELWNECNTILDQQLLTTTKSGPKTVHLLSGYLYCSCKARCMFIIKINLQHFVVSRAN